MEWSILAIVALRWGLVAVFVPFSVFYLVSDFRAARDQVGGIGVSRQLASVMTLGAIILKLVACVGFVSGIADRLSALMLGGFCVATAILYKQFWSSPGLRMQADDPNLPKLWDFWKNVGLAAAFVLVTFGNDAASLSLSFGNFLANPLSSSEPYRTDITAQWAGQDFNEIDGTVKANGPDCWLRGGLVCAKAGA